MSAGNFPTDMSGGSLPSIEEIIQQMEGFNIPPEAMQALNQYVMMIALQSQIGQQQLGLQGLGVQEQELGVRAQEAAAREAETQFRIEHQLPFQMMSLENDQLLAELNLQLQQERAANERLTNAEQLQQMRERGSYDSRIQAIGLETALVNLARQREAGNQSSTYRGAGQYTPRSVDTYGGVRF